MFSCKVREGMLLFIYLFIYFLADIDFYYYDYFICYTNLN